MTIAIERTEMKKYEVIIRAIVTKTYTVEANGINEAAITASDNFSVLEDDTDEDYEMDILSVEELK